MTVYLVRHTSVQLDGNTTCYGNTDVDVRSSFPEEASATRTTLAGIRVDAVFTSPLQRARKLADFCGYEHAHRDERLREMNFGKWETCPWSEIITHAHLPTFFGKYLNEPVPGGESLSQQQARVKDFLEEQKAIGYGSIIVFCHGGVINCARALAGHVSLTSAFDSLPAFGSVTTLEY